MAVDWLANVREYVPDADEGAVGAIVRHCGIALRSRDSSLVSFTDAAEVTRVRENFLRKKLALSDPDDVLDEAIGWVKELMKGDRTKNRVTVYYLLSHYFGKLDVFGGQGGTSATSLDGCALGATSASALAGLGTSNPLLPTAKENLTGPSVSELSAVSKPSTPSPPQNGADGALTTSPSRPEPTQSARSHPAFAANLYDGEDESGRASWLTWLLLALAAAGLIFAVRNCAGENSALPSNAAISSAAGATAASTEVDPNAGVARAGEITTVPVGAGVIHGIRENKPALTVYFDSGQASVSNDLANATANLKAYLDDNPGSMVAVSGYNDPTGNAALNVELSKNRAQAVAAALTAAGIPQASIELVKPDDTTSTSVTPEQARRVEVSVK